MNPTKNPKPILHLEFLKVLEMFSYLFMAIKKIP